LPHPVPESPDFRAESGATSLTLGNPRTYSPADPVGPTRRSGILAPTEGDTQVNKQDLITAVAEAVDLPKAKAGDVVDAVFEAVQKALKKKQEVRLVGFGTFSTSKRKAGKGRNPRTGEEIKIPASTTVRFKAGKGLKDAVN
jgi:DNA-binding protein HU-beta